MSCKSGAFYRSSKRLKLINNEDFIDLIKRTLLKTLNKTDPLYSVENYYEICPYILAKKLI